MIKRIEFGFVTSEYVTFALTVVVALGVGFGLYVGNERDNMVEKAEASLVEIKSQVDEAMSKGVLVTCSNVLVDQAFLENSFIPIEIEPIPIDDTNLSVGFGAGIVVKSDREKDGNDRFESAELLQKALEKEEEFVVRLNMQSEDEIAYTVLVSEVAICSMT